MRATTSIFVLLCCLSPVFANDTVITGVGGTWQPLKGEHKSIRMVREHVRMVVLPEYSYRVTADFVFHNSGRATSVIMGFPEDGGGVDVDADDYRNRSGFTSFATWVDGRRVRVRRIFKGKNSDSYQAYWIKRVRFRRGQTRRVRVQYLTECGGDSSGGSFAEYEFTGGNWKGNVDESLLYVTILVPGNNYIKTGFNYRQPTGRGSLLQNRRGNRFFYRFRNWQAEGDFSLRYVKVQPNRLAVNSQNLQYENEKILKIPFKHQPHILYVASRGAAALHHGTAVMAMRDLEKWLSWQYEYKQLGQVKTFESDSDPNVAPPQPCKVTWDERRKVAYLRADPHLFILRPGKTQMIIDGKVHRLPAPPLLVNGRGEYCLYIPLRPVITALGGTVKLKPQQHRVWFHL